MEKINERIGKIDERIELLLQKRDELVKRRDSVAVDIPDLQLSTNKELDSKLYTWKISPEKDSVKDLFDYNYDIDGGAGDWENEDYRNFEKLLAKEVLQSPLVQKILNPKDEWTLQLLYYAICVSQISTNGVSYDSRTSLADEVLGYLASHIYNESWTDWGCFWDFMPPAGLLYGIKKKLKKENIKRMW